MVRNGRRWIFPSIGRRGRTCCGSRRWVRNGHDGHLAQLGHVHQILVEHSNDQPDDDVERHHHGTESPVLPLADDAVGHLVVPDGDHDGGGNERAEKVHHHPRDEKLVPVAERSDEQAQAAQDVDGRQGGADVEHAQSYGRQVGRRLEAHLVHGFAFGIGRNVNILLAFLLVGNVRPQDGAHLLGVGQPEQHDK
uniref:(northern house mosquito) hypothetical protein n=1 Tax=Culex pipiens TaxID=7175 RepID=A0A8D8PED4_CULPI